MRNPTLLCAALGALSLGACAGPRFRNTAADGSVSPAGFRVYPPKPYLMVTRTADTAASSQVVLLPDLRDPQFIVPRGNGTWTATLERGMLRSYKEQNSSEAIETIDASVAALSKLMELTKPASKKDTPGGDPPPAPSARIQLFEITYDRNGCLTLLEVPQGECDQLCGEIARLPAVQKIPGAK
jgi:hypothetical protein